jgi:hypothetical protein
MVNVDTGFVIEHNNEFFKYLDFLFFTYLNEINKQ